MEATNDMTAAQAMTAAKADLHITPFTFEDTEITISAVSAAGRDLFAAMFGHGAVSITMPKSRGFDFERFVEQKGLVVA